MLVAKFHTLNSEAALEFKQGSFCCAGRLSEAETELAVSRSFFEYWSSSVSQKESQVAATQKDLSLAEVRLRQL